MTVVFVSKTEDLPDTIVGLPRGAEEYILSAASSAVRRERYSAYRLLSAALSRVLSENPARFSLLREGDRPYLSIDERRAGFDFNISHSAPFVVVALTDEGRVGVDVEKKISSQRAERLEKRFSLAEKTAGAEVGVIDASSAIFPDDYHSLPEDRFDECALNRDDFLFGFFLNSEPKQLTETQNLSFTERWTLCEAALKCDGRGMCGVGELSVVLDRLSSYTFPLRDGEMEYSLAVCLRRY